MTSSQPVHLQTMLGDYPNTRALKQGLVGSAGIALDFADVKMPNRAFKSVVRELKYDVAELAIVTFLQAKAYGKPLVLVPAVVGPGRFQHQCIVYNSEGGPLKPSGLAGRRVGVRAYSQTTGVWVRGILQSDYGVDPAKVRWVTFEGAHVAEYQDPAAVERAAEGKEMLSMLLAGELDAAVVGNEPPEDPRIKPLIPDAQAAAADWSRRNGAVPINHMIVIKESLSRSSPQVVREVFRMLLESKKAGQAQTGTAEFDMTPFGLEPNRRSLEIIIDYASKQGLLPRPLTVDELFDETTAKLG